MYKFFKGLKSAKKAVKAMPRAFEEIQKEYSELIGKVGQAQYQAFAYQREVDNLNQRLMSVNFEAKERQELNAKEASTQSESTKEAANE